MTLVSMGIGPLRRAQQRQPQDVSLCVVTIFAVIEQAESVLRIRDVSPPLCRNLKLRLFRRCIPSGRTLDRTKGNLKGRLVVVCADRETLL